MYDFVFMMKNCYDFCVWIMSVFIDRLIWCWLYDILLLIMIFSVDLCFVMMVVNDLLLCFCDFVEWLNIKYIMNFDVDY